MKRDEDGFYVGEVPGLRACYSQGKILDEMLENIKEVILLCLEEAHAEARRPCWAGIMEKHSNARRCELRRW